jgi:hypothetical protein
MSHQHPALFAFKTAFLRYNSYIIQFTNCMYISVVFSLFGELYGNELSEAPHSLDTLSIVSQPLLPQTTTDLFCLSTDLPVLSISLNGIIQSVVSVTGFFH